MTNKLLPEIFYFFVFSFVVWGLAIYFVFKLWLTKRREEKQRKDDAARYIEEQKATSYGPGELKERQKFYRDTFKPSR